MTELAETTIVEPEEDEEDLDVSFDLTVDFRFGQGAVVARRDWTIYGLTQTKDGTKVRFEKLKVAEYQRQQRVVAEVGFKFYSEDEAYEKYMELMIEGELHPRDFELPRKSLGFSFRVTL